VNLPKLFILVPLFLSVPGFLVLIFLLEYPGAKPDDTTCDKDEGTP
jgi:hypothetical protein